jgi:hypothetical protein
VPLTHSLAPNSDHICNAGTLRFEFDIVAVRKEACVKKSSSSPNKWNFCGNTVTVMNSKAVDEVMKQSNSPMLMGTRQSSTGTGGEQFCMQRFIKSKGSKANIVRASYGGPNKISVSWKMYGGA